MSLGDKMIIFEDEIWRRASLELVLNYDNYSKRY